MNQVKKQNCNIMFGVNGDLIIQLNYGINLNYYINILKKTNYILIIF